MCTQPITINKFYKGLGRIVSRTVPCGKCAECINKKRSELAALSVHQGLKSGKVSFFTFTYSNENVPVAISEDTLEGVPRLIGFGKTSDFMVYEDMPSENSVFLHPLEDYHFALSLRREDVKLVLKQFRTDMKRNFNRTPDFKYVVFGEYGDKTGRPHYHGLFFGLDAFEKEYLAKLWSKRFGFALCVPQTNRELQIDEIAKVSNYVSKYISKGVNQRFAHILPYVEKPRRQSSINFGSFDENELRQLSDFMKVAIYPSSPVVQFLDGLLTLNFLCSQNGERVFVYRDILMHFLKL